MNSVHEILGECAQVVAVREQVLRLFQRQSAARRFPPVLILGETGTGKGLLARSLHQAGPRASGPFVTINCAAIPDTLLEAELFGYERGAFTDAHRAKPGLFQVANGGTLFLDEIGLLPPPLQGKLLKAIEDREVRRLGATRNETVDVWILAAASGDLVRAQHEHRFHEALYHRLSVLTFCLPPLRQRGHDIPLLARNFLGAACADYGPPMKMLSPDAESALLAYPWPGNIRELANVMERVALLSEDATISADMLRLPEPTSELARRTGKPDAEPAETETTDPEKRRVIEALTQTTGNVVRAAKILGMTRNRLRYWMEKYDLGSRGGGEKPARSARIHEPIAESTDLPASPPRRSTEAADPPAAVPTLATSRAAVRWERRRVTLLRVVFAVPSETMLAPLPSIAARPVLDVAVEKVRVFDGRLEELSPDGIVAAFGVERAEDAAMRAALCALAIARATERVEPAIRGSRRERAATFRAAIHGVELTVGRIGARSEISFDDKYQVMEILEEMVERAESDAILVSEAASADVERRFHLGALGTLGETMLGVYRLGGHSPTPFGLRGRATPFVGRSHELELLRSRLTSAARGRGQVVAIAGEAGIGKSRLLYEFRQSIDQPFTYVEGRCVSYDTATPYLALLEIVRGCVGITDADDPSAIAGKVRSAHLRRLLGLGESTAALGEPSTQRLEAETLAAIRELVLATSRSRLLVIGLEDLQWMDATSAESFAALVDALPGASILVLATHRPGYRAPWLEKSYATQIALQALQPLDSLTVIHSLIPGAEVSDAAAQALLQKADGNPFFLEELARSLAEDGSAERALPGTIRAVITARIDRLADGPKRLLQAAAVLGREVSPKMLEAIGDGNGTFDLDLQELRRLEFLYEQSGPDGTVYFFKHALTQEVAYESLSPNRRRELREAAKRALDEATETGQPYRRVH